jgi:hypothetical protein
VLIPPMDGMWGELCGVGRAVVRYCERYPTLSDGQDRQSRMGHPGSARVARGLLVALRLKAVKIG